MSKIKPTTKSGLESLGCWKAEALRTREYIAKLEVAIHAAREICKSENRYEYNGTDEIVNEWALLNEACPPSRLTPL